MIAQGEREPEPQRNHLLGALSPEVQARLFPYLELVRNSSVMASCWC